MVVFIFVVCVVEALVIKGRRAAAIHRTLRAFRRLVIILYQLGVLSLNYNRLVLLYLDVLYLPQNRPD